MPTLFLRTLIVYFLMFAVLRLMGKRQISDMQPFDLAVTLLIANLASVPMAEPAAPLLYGVIPMLTLFIMHRLVSHASLKSERLRTFVCGSPLVVIERGVLVENAMKAANYSLSDLAEQLRLKDVFSIGDVEYAILETNGSLSVLLKPGCRQPTARELGVGEQPEPGPDILLVSDGRLHGEGLAAAGLTENRLAGLLRERGMASVKDCFFAVMSGNTLLTQKKLKQPKGGASKR